MVRKIRVATKKKEPVATENATKTDIVTACSNSVANNADAKPDIKVPSEPTCIRMFIDNESTLQYINNMMMRFNAEYETPNITLQRVGYKLNVDNKPSEIDMAILHGEGCVITGEEYVDINKYLIKNLEMNGVRYQFIDFADSHKNTGDAMAAKINDKNESVTEYITLEKGSISDELFEYLCSKHIGGYADIVQSIRIPVTKCFFTYKSEWVEADKNEDKSNTNDTEDKRVKEHNDQVSTKNDNRINVTICIYDPKASDSVDGLLSQFAKSIGNKVYDYAEQTASKYFRVINIDVIPDVNGMRLIDSFGWVNNIAVSAK